LNTTLFADAKVILSEFECVLETTIHQLQIITNSFNLENSAKEAKVRFFKASD
jgi:hypothetical protein